MTEKVLCVDDDPNILAACRRQLRKRFEVDTAASGEEALQRIGDAGPYAVVLTDMRMPGMDGVQLLKQVRETCPTTVRMMLTGYADQQTAIDAVNQGHIFRFLSKPCPAELVADALEAGVQQYRLVQAERELLEKTLNGSVKLLTDVLALVNPAAFGRASRVRRLAGEIAKALSAPAPWQIELAAMVSQIGCVTLPPQVLDKAVRGDPLSDAEMAMFQAHPQVGRELLANIPRLEPVAAIVALQEKRYDGSGPPPEVPGGDQIPLGARILKIALDLDALLTNGFPAARSVPELRARAGWYDPALLDVVPSVLGHEQELTMVEIGLDQLATGMVLAEDVVAGNGVLLLSQGHEVNPSMLARMRNFSRVSALPTRIHVLVPKR